MQGYKNIHVPIKCYCGGIVMFELSSVIKPDQLTNYNFYGDKPS
jgi:hypothetical protein